MKTVTLLAELYSAAGQRLTTQDLLAKPLEADAGTTQVRHAALAHRWFAEVWNQGRREAIEELTTADCHCHVSGSVLRSHTKIFEHIGERRKELGHFEMSVEQIIVQGDWIAARWRATVTHRRRVAGQSPMGGRRVGDGSSWLRVADGLFSEIWEYWP